MPGSISDDLELKLLDHTFKNTPFVQLTNIYIGYSTADPLDDGSGVAEPSDGAYARIIHNTWSTASSRALSNTGAIAFAEATESQGTITHWMAFDALTAGNLVAHGALTTSKVIVSGNTLSFNDGDIDITIVAAGATDYLADALLDHVFKNTAFVVPTNLYVAGLTVASADDDTGTTITEPTVGAYARKIVNDWDAAAAGATVNTNDLTFTTATASWGSIGWFGILDALTTGNLLTHGAVGTAQVIGDGDTLQFDAGDLHMLMD